MKTALLGVENSLSGRFWRMRLGGDSERTAERLAEIYKLNLAVARTLVGRGVTEEKLKSFLNSSLAEDLPDPFVLKDMQAGALRLADAIVNGEKIAVFGDYDVDGATSSAAVVRFLRSVGHKAFEVYIPNRMTEGYGPNVKAMVHLKKQGSKVVLTVDCGTLAYDALDAAADIGLDVIVCDHHIAGSELPRAFAVINPNRLDEDGSLGNLAAVGVVFLLLVATNRELRNRHFFTNRPEPDLKTLLDIVALGTVADVVALTNLNRTFVVCGLKIMSQSSNQGLKALMAVARLTEKPRAYHLGFLIGPRVNAGGRVGEVDLGWKILSTDNETEATQIASQLDTYNLQRQQIEKEVEAEAMAQAFANIEQGEKTLLLVAGKCWHPGVIGIVAGRLRERFDLPACVFSIDESGIAKGSARSVPGIDIGAMVIDALHHKLLKAGGGHAAAAGLTVHSDTLPSLKNFLAQKIQKIMSKGIDTKDYQIDALLAPKGITLDLLEALEVVDPCGSGNPAPRFAIADTILIEASRVGQGHVRVIMKGKDGGTIKGIAFRVAETPLGRALLTGRGRRFHVAGQLKLDEWQGVRRSSFLLEDAATA